MTYQSQGKIQSQDYNQFVSQINALYSTGSGRKGLGQTGLTTVASGNTVDNSEWSNLRTIINKIAALQGTSISTIPVIAEGDVVTYLSSIKNGVASIDANATNAGAQGTSIPTSTSYAGTWSNQLTYTHVITFESGDKARYFFNAGGQIAINFNKLGSSSMDTIWQSLITKIGTLFISAGGTAGTETSTIVNTSYTGFTQNSSSASKAVGRTIYDTSRGYYKLTPNDITVYKQTAQTTVASGYYSSFIELRARTNGSQGSYGDNGSTIIITTIWDEIPNGLLSSNGTTTTVTVRPPSTTNILNTWGNVTVSGSVTGS